MNTPKHKNVCMICEGETYRLNDPQIRVTYSVCKACGFTYKNRAHHLSLTEEKTQYDSHQNTMENEGYKTMFERFIEESITPYIKEGKALDFGSGPGPVLYELLKIKGFKASHYDPFYHKDFSVFDETYDLITSTEVFEHLNTPLKTLNHISALLEKGGMLAIMTSLRPKDDETFLKWWYRRDLTHVSFFTLKAIKALINPYPLRLIYTNEKNYFVFRKE